MRTCKLLYSTYLGGRSELDGEVNPNGDFVDNSTNGNNIAVDARGLFYLTGITMSRGGPAPAIKFPITGDAIQPDMKGDKTSDAFLCILDPAKSRLGLAALRQLPLGQRERKGTQRCGKRHRQRDCRGGLHQFLGLSDDPQRLSERPPAAIPKQRLCGSIPGGSILPRFRILPLHDAVQHVPGGNLESSEGRHLRRHYRFQRAHPGHGSHAVGRLSDDYSIRAVQLYLQQRPLPPAGQEQPSALPGEDRSFIDRQGIPHLFHVFGRRRLLHRRGCRFNRQCLGCRRERR